MSKIELIEPLNWESFLEEVSTRNNNRRARFEVFRGGGEEEEAKEAYFEDIRLEDDGPQRSIVVARVDRSDQAARKISDTITHVRGIAVQYDTDGSEAALEVTDTENEMVVLRFESKVDGAS